MKDAYTYNRVYVCISLAKNFRDFCTMLAENCPALEVLELWTPIDPRKQLELFFKELRDNHKISVIFKKHKQHPRRYR